MPLIPAEWSNTQLAEFSAEISNAPDEATALTLCVDRAAEALEAEVGVFIRDDRVATSVGFPAGRLPEKDLLSAAAEQKESMVLPGLGVCKIVVVRSDEPFEDKLLLARAGEDGFSPEDVNLLKGMIQVLVLTSHMFQLLQTERDLRERSRMIVESASDAFVSMTLDGQIIGWNAQAEKTFGWPREEAMGRELADTIIPMHLREAHRRGLKVFMNSGQGPILNKRLELIALHRSGREFPIELSVWVVKSGEVSEFNAFVRDISDRKVAEEQVAAARDAAMEASRMKSSFLANMSHEIRTPMNGIIGMSSLLLSTNLNDQQREYAETAKASSEALLSLINDILDVSKIESGKLELECINFRPDQVIAEVAGLLSQSAVDKGLKILIEIDPEIPGHLMGDPGRLRQILSNLVGNAIKFTERGQIVIRLNAFSEYLDQVRLHFEVSDTGIGMPESALGSVFESFSQADVSTTRLYGGTGLGLAISKQLAEIMGGHIGAHSKLGEGSTFWFDIELEKGHAIFPAGPDPDLFEERTQPSANASGQSNHGMANLSRKILVAEDNPVNQMVVGKILEKSGFTVDMVINGAQAVEAVAANDYSCVLMDCRMPIMDGYQATQKIRRLDGPRGQIGIIALTASVMKSDQNRCFDSGMNDFVSKPIRPETLMAAIERLARHAHEPEGRKDMKESTDKPSADGSELSALDPQALNLIRELGAAGATDIFREVVELYLQDAPGKVGTIRRALDLSDGKGLREAAHSLKGSSGNFGAKRLVQLSAELEKLGLSEELVEAQRLFPELEGEFGRVEQALKEEVAKAP